jgi:hypothetical protein
VVVTVGSGSYEPGVYRLGSAVVPGFSPREPYPPPLRAIASADARAALDGVSFVATTAANETSLPALSSSFLLVATRESVRLWIRNPTDFAMTDAP